MLLKEKNEVIKAYMREKKDVDYSTDLPKLWSVMEHIASLTGARYKTEWHRFKINIVNGAPAVEEHDFFGMRWKFTSEETEESLHYQLFDCIWAIITNLNNQKKKAE